MSRRTHELFEFVQMEPLALADIRMMLTECDEDEIGMVEQIADNLKEAISLLGITDEEFNEVLWIKRLPLY